MKKNLTLTQSPASDFLCQKSPAKPQSTLSSLVVVKICPCCHSDYLIGDHGDSLSLEATVYNAYALTKKVS